MVLLLEIGMAMVRLEGCSNESCPEAFNAGVDIYMAPDSWKNLHRNLMQTGQSSGEILN